MWAVAILVLLLLSRGAVLSSEGGLFFVAQSRF